MTNLDKYFYKSQRDWILDDSPLKIAVKSRQVGFSYANAFRLVLLVSAKDAKLDAFISSRDEFQAKLQLEDCAYWADELHSRAKNLGEAILDSNSKSSAHVLQFANGRRIYSLSSNPNALAGKRGHITLDEFALHQDQRLLYRVAKPVTTWGGQLSIISTHRGIGTLFYQLIRDITENGNPMGWSYHYVPIQKAVEEGIVERINAKKMQCASASPERFSLEGSSPSPRPESSSFFTETSSAAPGEGGIFAAAPGEGEPYAPETREGFLARVRRECIDEEQWKQEYCCIPADENSAFFSYEMLDACTDPNLKVATTLEEFLSGYATRNTQYDSNPSTPDPRRLPSISAWTSLAGITCALLMSAKKSGRSLTTVSVSNSKTKASPKSRKPFIRFSSSRNSSAPALIVQEWARNWPNVPGITWAGRSSR